MLKARYKLFSFSTRDSNRGYTIDKDAFLKVVNSDKFQKALKTRIMFGSLSHQVRDDFQSKRTKSVGNHSDFLLHDYQHTCNVVTDIEIIGDDVFCELVFLDNDAGKFCQMLLTSIGTPLNVSMSIMSELNHSQKKYLITEFIAVDTTTAPALASEYLGFDSYEGVSKEEEKLNGITFSKNVKSIDEYIGSAEFSSKGTEDNKSEFVTFSCSDASLESVNVYKADEEKEKNVVNFSVGKTSTTEDVMECFSVGFMQFYLEETRPARDSLKRRIQQVVNFIKSKDKDTLSKLSVKRAMRKYIYMFILQKIQDYVSMLSKSGADEEGGNKSANLMVALGIGPYLTDRKAIGRLQMTLKMLAPQLKKDGTMQKPIQLKIKQAFASVFNDILRTIEKKFLPEEKRGFLTSSGKSVVSGKAETKAEKPAIK